MIPEREPELIRTMDWYESESDKSIVSTNSQESTDNDNDNLAAVTSDNNILVSGLHCTLSRFKSKHRSGQTAVTTGWIDESLYVMPLHTLSVVPGQTGTRGQM